MLSLNRTATFIWCIRVYAVNCYFRLMYQGVCYHWTATFFWCIRVYAVIERLLSFDVSGCMLSLNRTATFIWCIRVYAVNCYFRLMYQGVCWHWTAAFVWCIRVYVGIELLLSTDVSGCIPSIKYSLNTMWHSLIFRFYLVMNFAGQ
jgi:hypothetical protein